MEDIFKTLGEILKPVNKVECPECVGDGKVLYSCCGDDVKGTEYEDYGLCPTCKEHISTEYEVCETCEGTGEIEE